MTCFREDLTLKSGKVQSHLRFDIPFSFCFKSYMDIMQSKLSFAPRPEKRSASVSIFSPNTKARKQAAFKRFLEENAAKRKLDESACQQLADNLQFLQDKQQKELEKVQAKKRQLLQDLSEKKREEIPLNNEQDHDDNNDDDVLCVGMRVVDRKRRRELRNRFNFYIQLKWMMMMMMNMLKMVLDK